jgi:hypothetical protein
MTTDGVGEGGKAKEHVVVIVLIDVIVMDFVTPDKCPTLLLDRSSTLNIRRTKKTRCLLSCKLSIK